MCTYNKQIYFILGSVCRFGCVSVKWHITFSGLAKVAIFTIRQLSGLMRRTIRMHRDLRSTEPPLLPNPCYHQCFLVCRGLSVYLLLSFSLSFCRAVGHFLKFLFSWVGFASSFKSFGLALAGAAFKCACKMRWLKISFYLFRCHNF